MSNKAELQIGFSVDDLESIFYVLSQAVDRLQDFRRSHVLSPADDIELAAIRELVRDGRGPINAKLMMLYHFDKG
jgi:hypothetical protein